MSGKLFEGGYGAILDEDINVLETVLREAVEDARARTNPGETSHVSVLEIGMHDGNTARGIEKFLTARSVFCQYIGIDPDDGSTRPRYTPLYGEVIVGDSAESFHKVPDNLDVVWVDGCHCICHSILDTVLYAPKVRVGGWLLFHDVNPAGQGQEQQPYHGPQIPEFGLATNLAHKLIHWPFENWALVMEKWPTDVHNCGTAAYRRIR